MTITSEATKYTLVKPVRFANHKGLVDLITAIETAVEARIIPLEVVANNIPLLAQDISAAYVEAEVQAISDKVDALLTALIGRGIIGPAV